MGRATEMKAEQIQYIKHRLRLLNEVGQALDDSASVDDLRQLGFMLEKLNVKLNVFIGDWENTRAK